MMVRLIVEYYRSARIYLSKEIQNEIRLPVDRIRHKPSVTRFLFLISLKTYGLCTDRSGGATDLIAQMKCYHQFR